MTGPPRSRWADADTLGVLRSVAVGLLVALLAIAVAGAALVDTAFGAVAGAGGLMPPATALALSLLAVGIVGPPRWRRRSHGALAAALIVQVAVRLDILLPSGRESTFFDGAMRVSSWGSLVAVSCILVTARASTWRRPWGRPVADAGAAVAFAIGWVGMVGHLYAVDRLYTLGSSEMAAQSALGVMLAATAAAALVDHGALARIASGGPGGVMLRRLLPIALVGLPVMGWARLAGQRAGWYDTTVGLVIVVTSAAALMLLALWRAAAEVDHLDAARATAAATLADTNARLGMDRDDAIALFRAAFRDSPIGMVVTRASLGDHDVLHCNEAFATMTRRSDAQLEAFDLFTAVHGDHMAALRCGLRDLLSGEATSHRLEARLLDGAGAWRWFEVTRTIVVGTDHEPRFVLAQFVDIAERKAAEDEHRRLADTDPLTGLVNRRGFEAAITALGARPDHGGRVTVAFVDVDRFKDVNDTHGHDYGDMVLLEVARTLRATVRRGDTVARLGGDEFAVVLAVDDPHEVGGILDRLGDAIRISCPSPDGSLVEVTASVGVATASSISAVADIVAAADRAMYQAKRQRQQVARAAR